MTVPCWSIPLILMLNQVLKEPDPYPWRYRVFLALLIVWFLPLVPNVLLRAEILAWWALPLPILFGVLAMEIWRRSALASQSLRI